MVSGEKGLLGFHRRSNHHHQQQQQQQPEQEEEEEKVGGIPKGCLAVKVGQHGGKQQRFVVPVMYLNHPLFIKLLKEAEEEYGFEQKGAIQIPCHVEDFRYLRGLIDKDVSHDHHSHHHQHSLVGCFRV